MRAPVRSGEDRLRRGCENLAAVLERTHTQCGQRHARLAAAAGAGCAGTVTGPGVERLSDGKVQALVERGGGHRTPVGRLGDGELRYLALDLVLLTGPGVLAMEAVGEVPSAMQTLTVLADGLAAASEARGTAGVTVVDLEP